MDLNKISGNISPDDVEDVKEFAIALSNTISIPQLLCLIEELLRLAKRAHTVLDLAEIYDPDNMRMSGPISVALHLFIFLRDNEVALNKLSSLRQGEAFLNDPTDH